MAVTTEPPWLNKAAGTAPRNGTTSHTISFGFTSTSGSLLVAVVHGAVTHAASGWTKQAGPIATGECSLFTKTSAGESSITVTHNGSNYPVNYVIYEFATGSAITGVDSTTGSNDTMVGLTGLPGTAQVVIAALGRVPIGAESGASITPSAPWVEDGDLFAPAGSGTDGSYLAVVHQINVTSTSITPVVSPTYSGTWSNGSREKISAAFDVVPGATVIDGTATVTGSGSAAATSRQQSGATVAGAGAVAATTTLPGTAARTGTGTTAGVARQQSSASVTGAGSVVANAAGTVSGTATVSGAATVTGITATRAGSTVAGLGARAAVSATRSTSSAAGAGTVTAGAAGTVPGTASVTGAGAVGALAATGPAGSVAGLGGVSAAGVIPGSSSATGAGAVTALVRHISAADVTGTGSVLAAQPGQLIDATAAVAGVGLVSANSNAKTTPRPNAGSTTRPFAGVTARP